MYLSMDSPPKEKSVSPSYYYETSDLVIIALFAALGGVFSNVIANIANIFNSIVAGGGQLFAGLHVFWFVLVFLFTYRKFGVVIITGIIKGLIELFMGNPLGIIVVFIALGEAVVFEIVYFSLTSLLSTQKIDNLKITIAAGFSTAINVIILLNILLGKDVPNEIILLMLSFSFISGILFGGILGIIFFRLFQQSELLNWRKEFKKPDDSFSSQKTSE